MSIKLQFEFRPFTKHAINEKDLNIWWQKLPENPASIYFSVEYKVDKKAMIRNWCNRVPHPALNTKQERDTYN